ncbi:cell division protein SepF [Corynebacterium breve]|uniref:Cell division protein SepF n=1 Tax=Corynebacterium breve TaxID=3049799 RepID=A0ABY8VCY1_9CORY|nr:cell division protein SepF [Corynebacterium breve]WIM66967.1 cell division protein SepF [Corynebacterium breve]
MSIMKSAKEFFGFAPYGPEDDAYYDEPRYQDDGSAAYEPVAERSFSYGADRVEPVERAPRAYAPAVVAVALRSYDEAKEIGEPFRDGDAVVMDLTELDRDARKAVVDFSAGLCFALRGQMHNLTRYSDTDRRVFAIVPENARITTLELERAAKLR